MRHRGGDGADRAGVAHPGTPRLPDVSTASPAVEIDALVMRYGDKLAVDGLSLQVARGSITAVLGPRENPAEQLRMLARISRVLKDQTVRKRLLDAASCQDALSIVIEEELRH